MERLGAMEGGDSAHMHAPTHLHLAFTRVVLPYLFHMPSSSQDFVGVKGSAKKKKKKDMKVVGLKVLLYNT